VPASVGALEGVRGNRLHSPDLGDQHRTQGVDQMAENNREREIADIQSYPILTQDLSYAPVPGQATTTGAPGGGAPLKQIAENAIRNVLGWRPKVSDPKAILAALNQSFSPKEEEGHTNWQWTPRSYAAQVDMSAITGAQASLYQRAKTALDQSLPLLDGLYALDVAADPQDSEATRAIVRSAMTELVTELGQIGGPRPQRVDDYFRTLLDYNPRHTAPLTLSNPDSVRGQLGVLRERFGLTRNRVNTVDEEQNLTNFFIIVNYFDTLMVSWDTDRALFVRDPGRDAFLGTQQVLMLQSLAALAEEVQQAYFIFDSLFIGPAERQTTYIPFDGVRLTLAELLEWVDSFASDEAPRLIQDGGKDGVTSIVPTLEKLRDLVDEALALARKTTHNPSKGFHSARSQIALEELSQQLKTTSDLAAQIRRGPIDGQVVPIPQISRVVPNHASKSDSQPVTLTIFGDDFVPGATVELDFPSGNPASTAAGQVDGRRRNPSVTPISGNGQDGFDLQLMPWGDGSGVPTSGNNLILVGIDDKGLLHIRIFDARGNETTDTDETKLPSTQAGTISTLKQQLPGLLRLQVLPRADKAQLISEARSIVGQTQVQYHICPSKAPTVGDQGTTITAQFDLTDAAVGSWDVIVTNPGTATEPAQSDTLPGAFRVDAVPAPKIQQVVPASAVQGPQTEMRIKGRHFQQGAAVQLTRDGDTANPKPGTTSVASDGTLITTSFDLSSVDSGDWDVTVQNPDLQSDTLLGSFSVEAAPDPQIQQIKPDSGEENTQVPVRVKGSNFRGPVTITLTFPGKKYIPGDSPALVSGNKLITTTFNLPDGSAGDWDVVVVNRDGSTDILLGGFTILPSNTATAVAPENQPTG
jgi:hypothetical protein